MEILTSAPDTVKELPVARSLQRQKAPRSKGQVWTQQKVNELVRDGRGQGKGEAYQPWLWIRRRFCSPVSNLHIMHVPYMDRPLHLMSCLERSAAEVAAWLGITVTCEQKPAWPHEHWRPLTPDRDRARVPGLVEIAREAGIDHGFYIGPKPKVYYVATLDFLHRIDTPDGNTKLLAWSCKPRALLDGGKGRARILERIELDRRYSAAIRATHKTFDGTEVTKTIVGQLDWLRPSRAEYALIGSARLVDFSGEFLHRSTSLSLGRAIDSAGSQMGMQHEEADSYFRTAAWLGLIDIDLTQTIYTSKPIRRDGGALRRRLTKQLLEDVQ